MKIGGKAILHEFDSNTKLEDITRVLQSKMCGANEIWYRGEAMKYPTTALPVLARTENTDLSPIEKDFTDGIYTIPMNVMTKSEEDFIKDVQADNPPDPYFHKLVTSNTDPAWLAMARHHGYPTRLLDVTSDIRIALYFACSEHPKEDSYIFAYIDVWNPEKNTKLEIKDYKKLFDPALGDHIPTYREEEIKRPGVIAGHIEMLNHSIPDIRANMAYLFECNKVLNERMNAQKGAFIWRGDPKKNMLEDISSIFIFKINAGAKIQLMSDLDFHKINKKSLKI